MLELVIFDMDGLMFATEQVNCRAFMEVVKEEGYHPTFEQFTSFLGMNARDIQKKYYDYYGEIQMRKAFIKGRQPGQNRLSKKKEFRKKRIERATERC